MYVNVNEIKATNKNVVIEIIKWPASFSSSNLVTPMNSSYDNGRELYLAEVVNSDDAEFRPGTFIAIDIYYGFHVPLLDQTKKVKIIPSAGIVLKGKKKLDVMSDVAKMEPGKDRILIKLKKKEEKTVGGIIIPSEVLGQDPTAQDIRFADVVEINKSVKGIKKGDVVVVEATVGKDIYLDSDAALHVVCYATDVLGTVHPKDQEEEK
ncbi:MAG: hypothetical protein KAH32_06005 [Chlamydiia bacterium]|nr:hypothetical protein [Chlamydiia bacterium]